MVVFFDHFRMQSEEPFLAIPIPKNSIRDIPYLVHFEISQRGDKIKKKMQ